MSAKIEDGTIAAAVRIVTSEDRSAQNNDATLAKLQAKHPAAATNRHPVPDPTSTTALQVTEADVLRAIRSFPAGSSGGPDGLRPQHVLDLINCRESGSELLSAITSFANTLLSGQCHPSVVPILFGGSLIALEKKSGGIRPIAIGYTWRRIAAKCATFHASSRLRSVLSPRQLGVGISGGCEAAVHATRRFSSILSSDSIIAKLDFTNAFNSVHRDAMLESVSSLAPEIYSFCHLCYNRPSVLKFGNREVLSQEGVQQGDPLGPLLFCLTIHPMLSSLKSDLVIGYLDDITLGGSVATVSEDVEAVRSQGLRLGLTLNDSKCELISSRGVVSVQTFKDFVSLDPDKAILLGAPLSKGPAMDEALQNRCSDLSRAIDRLKLLSAHDALILLRSSFSAPKLLHTLRSSPCADHPCLITFDKS